MQYRPFGNLDFRVSALGFGAMRFPLKDDKIDEGEATRMLHYAIERGVNYVDTAYTYHDGQSEVFLGRVLQGGYREKVKVATKLPSWLVQTSADFDRYLDEQLQRLDLDYLDFYLLHSLNKKAWRQLYDLGVLEWAERAMASGRFHYLGFSFHDDYQSFQEIVDAYDWSMCQIQYNYMDVQNQAGMEGLKYAAAKGLAVVVMEPLLGGKLVAPPPSVQAIWDESPEKRTAADWALAWLWNQPEVATVLSGMSSMAQVEENVALAASSQVGMLTPAELTLYDRVREAYLELTAIPCTNCRYCLPCPQNVDIPANFANYNGSLIYDKLDGARGQYEWWKYAYEVQKSSEHDIRAARCIQCGECEAKCPQQIPISKWMPVINGVLGEGKPFVKEV